MTLRTIVDKLDEENKVEHYITDDIEACTIMDLISIPEGLTGSQVHSLFNIVKRIRRFGKKDEIGVEARKLSEEFNKLVNGEYR